MTRALRPIRVVESAESRGIPNGIRHRCCYFQMMITVRSRGHCILEPLLSQLGIVSLDFSRSKHRDLLTVSGLLDFRRECSDKDDK